MRSMLIVNPSSGPWDTRRELPSVLTQLEQNGWRTTLHETTRGGEATELALRAVAEELDAVFVVGGDGTINEVVNGLAGSQVAMGVLPGGTGNTWARGLGLPRRSPMHWQRLRDSVEALLRGSTRKVDLGRINDRYFLQWAGLGLDADVAYAMEPRSRGQKRLGAAAYVVAGLATAFHMVGTRTRIHIDDDRIYRRCILVVISNSRLYGGGVLMTSGARLDDGLLDVNVFAGTGFGSALRTFGAVITGLHVWDRRYSHYQGHSIRIESDTPMSVHVDGEPFDKTPIECQVVPRALSVILPKQVPPELFTH